MNLKFRQFALLAIPLRSLWSQAMVALLLLSSLVLIFVARYHADAFADLRLRSAAAMRPLVMAVTEPAVLVQNFAGQLQTAVVLQMETKALREEVATLREWQAEAVRLRAENQALRNLLTMRAAHEVTSAAGKVLADQGANFGQSVLVAVPAEFPLRRGLVAMTDVGMVGRTVEISQGAGLARVLLLSDPASRLPVMLEGSRIRAILAGQGTHELLLEHLPSGNMPQVGEKIVSAGSDGVLPSDLPLAQVTRIDGDRVYAAPLAPLDRIEWLRLVDFGTIATLNKPNFQSSGF